MDSPEPSVDESTQKQVGRVERRCALPDWLGGAWWWRGSPTSKAEPLAKAEGPDAICSDIQRDLTSGMLKVNTSALRVRGE